MVSGSMGGGSKYFQMEILMKVVLRMVLRKGKVCICGQMDAFMRGSLAKA